jgi:hypothetical protein
MKNRSAAHMTPAATANWPIPITGVGASLFNALPPNPISHVVTNVLPQVTDTQPLVLVSQTQVASELKLTTIRMELLESELEILKECSVAVRQQLIDHWNRYSIRHVEADPLQPKPATEPKADTEGRVFKAVQFT